MGKGDEHSVPTKTRRAEVTPVQDSRAGMQTSRALFIMALAPLVAGFGSFTPDAITPPGYTPVCSSPVPLLPLETIATAVSASNCQAVVAATMIQFDRVAAASSKTPEDNKNCLADAYAQPGFCALTKEMVALFTGNACGAASTAISAQLTMDLAASFGAEGSLYCFSKRQLLAEIIQSFARLNELRKTGCWSWAGLCGPGGRRPYSRLGFMFHFWRAAVPATRHFTIMWRSTV